MSSREKEFQRDSPLLRLPAELRIMIYECLSDMTTYKLKADRTNQSRSRWIIERSIGPLRQVCQQLKSETRDFQFRPPTMLDLRANCGQNDILWLMRTGRFATITTISVHSANFDMNFSENIHFAAWEMMWPAWWFFRYEKDPDDEWANDEDTSEDDMDIDSDSDSDADASESASEDPDPFPAWKHEWLSTYFSNIQAIRFCDLPKATIASQRMEADAKALLHNPSLTFSYVNIPEVETLRPTRWGATANLDLRESLRLDDEDEEECGTGDDRESRLARDELPSRPECVMQ